MAILLVYIVFAVLSLIFPGLSKLSKLLQHYNDNAYNNLYQILPLKLILRLKRGNSPESMSKPRVYL